MLSALELSDAPQQAIETIRGPVRLASERAGKRYAEEAEAEEQPGEGVDVEGGDGAMVPVAASA